MMQELPVFVSLIFGITVLITIFMMYRATQSKKFLLSVVLWTLVQSALGISGIYQKTDMMPPTLLIFGLFPAIVTIMTVFFTKAGIQFIETIDLKIVTYSHIIRIPVEIVLTLLFHYGVMSVYITFEGTNFDILSGISAPIIAYISYRSMTVNHRVLLWWNVICLLLLLNVVITAIFAIPSPVQKIAFDQPNIAVLYFPFNLLPTIVVPLVLFGHCVAIKRLLHAQ